jgi:DNA-binding Lrp family transcriptional regulator
MLKVRPGRERSVYHALQGMRGIKDVYPLFGEFDLFVVMQVEGRKGLDQLVERIRQADEVTEACPMLVTRESGLARADEPVLS